MGDDFLSTRTINEIEAGSTRYWCLPRDELQAFRPQSLRAKQVVNLSIFGATQNCVCSLDAVEDHLGVFLLAGIDVLVRVIHPTEALVCCIYLFESCLFREIAI